MCCIENRRESAKNYSMVCDGLVLSYLFFLFRVLHFEPSTTAQLRYQLTAATPALTPRTHVHHRATTRTTSTSLSSSSSSSSSSSASPFALISKQKSKNKALYQSQPYPVLYVAFLQKTIGKTHIHMHPRTNQPDQQVRASATMTRGTTTLTQ